MLKTAICIIVFCVLPIIFILCGSLIYKIWKADPQEIKRVRQLKHTVKLANKGNQNAILECENNSQVRKGLRCVGKQVVTHYSVPDYVIMRAYNMF